MKWKINTMIEKPAFSDKEIKQVIEQNYNINIERIKHKDRGSEIYYMFSVIIIKDMCLENFRQGVWKKNFQKAKM